MLHPGHTYQSTPQVRQQILDALLLIPGAVATLVRNLITDYEALLAERLGLIRENIAILDERDQLRREVERLQAQIDQMQQPMIDYAVLRPIGTAGPVPVTAINTCDTTTTHRDVYAADERRTSP
jgi:hypothetical protein